MNTIDHIGRALHMTGRIVHGIRDDQWDNPTPCTDWTVWDVLNHTVGGLRIFTAQLTRTAAGADHDSDWLGTDAAGSYDQAAHADRVAWSDPTALDRTITISLGALPARAAAAIHLTEIVVHGLDLAVATGQTGLIDDELCRALLALMLDLGGMEPYRQPGIFGPAVEAPRSATPHTTLMTYLGRSVAGAGTGRDSTPASA